MLLQHIHPIAIIGYDVQSCSYGYDLRYEQYLV